LLAGLAGSVGSVGGRLRLRASWCRRCQPGSPAAAGLPRTLPQKGSAHA